MFHYNARRGGFIRKFRHPFLRFMSWSYQIPSSVSDNSLPKEHLCGYFRFLVAIKPNYHLSAHIYD